MYFKIAPEVIPTFGRDREILSLFDTIKQSNYDYSNIQYQILVNIIENNLSIEECSKRWGEEVNILLDKLQDYGLGDYYSSNVHIEKIKTINTDLLKNERLNKFRLKRLSIELTGECNFNCKFCTSDNLVYRTCGCKKWSDKQRLSLYDYDRIIDSAIKLGVERVDFIGGEPFLCWDLLKPLIEKLYKNNIQCVVFTNGSLIDKEKAAFIKSHEVTIILQLFGTNQEAYNNIMESPVDIYKNVQQGISFLRNSNINFFAHLIVSKFNEDCVETIKNELNDINLQEIYIYPTNAFYSPLYYDKMMDVSVRKLDVNVFTYQYTEVFNNCLYGQIFIACDGNLYPCVMLRDLLGNIMEETLWEIFYKRKHKKYWTVTKKDLESCCNCEKNLVCFDCRALDSFASKNFKGMKFCNRI